MNGKNTRKARRVQDEPSVETLREIPEGDFAKLRPRGRGIYYERYQRYLDQRGPLDQEVRQAFPSWDSVNRALRAVMELRKATERVLEQRPRRAGRRSPWRK